MELKQIPRISDPTWDSLKQPYRHTRICQILALLWDTGSTPGAAPSLRLCVQRDPPECLGVQTLNAMMQSLEVGTQDPPVTTARQSSSPSKTQHPHPQGQRAQKRQCVTAHLCHLLLVQLEHLSGAGGRDLLVGQVARMGAVTTVPRQHKDHLEDGQMSLGFLLYRGDVGMMTVSCGWGPGADPGLVLAQPLTQQVSHGWDGISGRKGTGVDSSWGGPWGLP